MFSGLFTLLFLGILAVAGAVLAVIYAPLPLPSDKIDFVIDQGSTMRSVARQVHEAGVGIPPEVVIAVARITKTDTQVKAGGYELSRGETLWTLLTRMSRGDVTQREVAFIEGWTFKQIRVALGKHPDITQTLPGLDDASLLKELGAEETHPEGLFFPDTYLFARGAKDVDILRRAYRAQKKELAEIWAKRTADLPLRTPYEALIMASIVEKETGLHTERERISGVFANRLRINMPLQTDPTVIYGMGDAFDGNLRRRDLRTDTPWNTYTRNGLPPTPIAAPGRQALLAAVQPEKHKFFYFVSRGDGTSAFSEDLAGHNRQVARYIAAMRAAGRAASAPVQAVPGVETAGEPTAADAAASDAIKADAEKTEAPKTDPTTNKP
ncbi:endolytic transglycosylase MltG [Pigmentiphaga aceris]|uniref:Endolytic murein transglycosylase n=1 Tax=Pigmentiphaga aceris TaxID=1940612 RepID=A0A5C0B512_9BURK|nr:endolytic transglycosylase MltG [Pigmentiphaga aceris]